TLHNARPRPSLPSATGTMPEDRADFASRVLRQSMTSPTSQPGRTRPGRHPVSANTSPTAEKATGRPLYSRASETLAHSRALATSQSFTTPSKLAVARVRPSDEKVAA